MKKVAIIDYGMSNLHSVNRALEYVAGNDWQVVVTSDAQVVEQADKIVFPGQGASGECMRLLKAQGLDAAILKTIHQRPFLGICLGLQTLLTHSEENGGTQGFDIIQGTVKRFVQPLRDNQNHTLKVPHMGWNQVFQACDHPLWRNIPDGSRFYFVHSYHAQPDDPQYIAATTPYGHNFTSAIAFDHVLAVQFHPEKSQRSGLTLLKNFLDF
jgi:glutamine amidotransferase